MPTGDCENLSVVDDDSDAYGFPRAWFKAAVRKEGGRIFTRSFSTPTLTHTQNAPEEDNPYFRRVCSLSNLPPRNHESNHRR